MACDKIPLFLQLLIKGIRSFSPDNQVVIEFYKPLTLIVGQNGAGKTTIIECLRQACTGQLPPNTKSGQSFIHDPKVAGETEVKAAIKLRFATSTGQPVVVQRSFSLTQKKATAQFKTLEGMIQTINKDTGQKEAITYRCADIDRIVPSLMGVSKAILEHVIFVHQEDSNWPLADGATLKRNFDEIFAATKYTKALEALRKLKTEKVAEIKEMKLKLDHLRTIKDTAQRHQADIQEGKDKMAKIEAQMRELEAQLQQYEGSMQAVEAQLNQLSAFSDDISRKETQVELLQKAVVDKRARLQDTMSDTSSDELQAFLDRFEQELGSSRAEVDQLQRELRNKHMDMEAFKDQYQRDMQRHAKLEAEAKTHQSMVADRDKLARELSAKFGIPLQSADPSTPLSEDAVSAFQHALSAHAQSLQQNLANVRAAHRSTEQKMVAATDATQSQLTRVQESLRMNKEQMGKNNASMDSLQKQLMQTSMSLARYEEICERSRQAHERLQTKVVEEQRSGLDAVISTEKAELESLARRISTLRSERDSLVVATESTTRLRLKRQDLAAKEEQLHALMASKRARLASLLGLPLGTQLPPAEQLREAASKALQERQAQVTAKQRELQDVQSQHQMVTGSLNAASSQLSAREAELNRLRDELRTGMARALGVSAAEEGAYVDQLARSQAQAEHSSKKMSDCKAVLQVLGNYKVLVQESHQCPLCTRPFKGTEEKVCVDNIDAEMTFLPSQLASKQAELAELQRQVSALQQLQPLWVRYSDLRDKELPALKERVASLTRQQQELGVHVQEAADVCSVLEVEVAEASKLMQDTVWPLDQLARSVAQLTAEVRAMEATTLAQPGARTVSDVDNEMDELEAQRRRHELARDEAARRQGRLKDEVMALQSAWMAVQQEQQAATAAMERQAEMQSRIKDLEAENVTLEATGRQLAAQQSPLVAQRDSLTRDLEAKRQEHASAERDMEERWRECVMATDQLETKCRPVAEYYARGCAAALSKAATSLATIKSRMDAASASLAELETKFKEKEKRASELELYKREVADVLEFRRQTSELDSIRQDLERLRAQAGQSSGKQPALVAQLQEIDNSKSHLKSRIDMLRGALVTTQHAVQKATAELAQPQYNAIETRYAQQLIQLKTTEMANNDLEKYHKALEKALLAFHTSKMSDINRLIKELWQQTYRGQDIDYIQIVADADGQRSYNYRVVMYSGGAELDMRGRCSAGQKVLASLVIRLALAETFCLNCGILALDEPTTNLDAENSASLAEALRAIMQSRKGQENFQLIVITHDERFAQCIGTHEHAEYLWRITKDAEQHTKVECEAIDAD